MARVRVEEEWARAILSRALDADVHIHDTGALPGMYDLEISYTDGSRAAAEVVAAADAQSIELWRLVNSGGRWQMQGLTGGWSVSLDPRARGRRVIAELPELLHRLEIHGIVDIRAAGDATFEFAQSLGVVDVRQSGTDFPGSIYLTIDPVPERAGGIVPQTGDPLAVWLAEFLHEEAQGDVREKLQASSLTERHAVVFFPGFTLAPFPVADLMMRDDAPLPEDCPRLPVEVTHVWAFSSWSYGHAIHWSPSAGWRKFPKVEDRSARRMMSLGPWRKAFPGPSSCRAPST